MNDFLSTFIDHIRDLKLKKLHSMGYKYGNHGKLKKNREQKLQILEKEAKNYEVMLTNLTEEHLKYAHRVSQVSDHKFIMELRQDVETSKDQINQLQK